MSIQGQVEIEPHHRNRLAIVYVRQACVSGNAADLARLKYQRGQAGHALAWGWRESAIQVIDEDVGRDGHTTEDRAGYQRLCRMLAAGQVGMVLVSDEARLTRSATTFAQFLGLCRKGETLLAIDGRLMSPRDPMCYLFERMQRVSGISEEARAYIARDLDDLANAIAEER